MQPSPAVCKEIMKYISENLSRILFIIGLSAGNSFQYFCEDNFLVCFCTKQVTKFVGGRGTKTSYNSITIPLALTNDGFTNFCQGGKSDFCHDRVIPYIAFIIFLKLLFPCFAISAFLLFDQYSALPRFMLRYRTRNLEAAFTSRRTFNL